MRNIAERLTAVFLGYAGRKERNSFKAARKWDLYAIWQLMSSIWKLRLGVFVFHSVYDTVLFGGEKMKITINIDENVPETEITISCNQLTEEIENIMATLRILNQQILVYKDEENHLLDVGCISYIEALERKTFVYTEADVFESKLKLYEMGEKLCRSVFFRISKSCLDFISAKAIFFKKESVLSFK